MTSPGAQRVRGIWLAALVALSVFTLGSAAHSPAASSSRPPSAAVIQAGSHLDQAVLTRAPSSHVSPLKTPAPYGDLAAAAALIGLGAGLLSSRSGRRPQRLWRAGPPLSRAPPLAA